MHIHILQVRKDGKFRENKDTIGGFGTVNDYGTGLFPKLLSMGKKKHFKFLEILPAYLSAILKNQGHHVTYGEHEVVTYPDVVMIHTSIINYKLEIEWAKKIKSYNHGMKVVFFGAFCSIMPELFEDVGDAIIVGEPEVALINYGIDFVLENGGKDYKEYASGPTMVEDLDSLPFPDWDHYDRKKYLCN